MSHSHEAGDKRPPRQSTSQDGGLSPLAGWALMVTPLRPRPRRLRRAPPRGGGALLRLVLLVLLAPRVPPLHLEHAAEHVLQPQQVEHATCPRASAAARPRGLRAAALQQRRHRDDALDDVRNVGLRRGPEQRRALARRAPCSKTIDAEGTWHSYPYRKPTALYSNVSGLAPRRCTCEGRRHASSIVGDRARGKRNDWGQGHKARLSVKHTVPTSLLVELLTAVDPAATGRLSHACRPC